MKSTPQELGMLKRERSERFYFLVANIEAYSAAISITIMPDKSIAVNLKEVTRIVIIYLSFVKG